MTTDVTPRDPALDILLYGDAFLHVTVTADGSTSVRWLDPEMVTITAKPATE